MLRRCIWRKTNILTSLWQNISCCPYSVCECTHHNMAAGPVTLSSSCTRQSRKFAQIEYVWGWGVKITLTQRWDNFIINNQSLIYNSHHVLVIVITSYVLSPEVVVDGFTTRWRCWYFKQAVKQSSTHRDAFCLMLPVVTMLRWWGSQWSMLVVYDQLDPDRHQLFLSFWPADSW